MTVGYPVRAGGRVQGRADAVGSAVPPSPPPALTVGDRIERRPTKTHCKRGHEFTRENTHVRRDGKGVDCKTCRRQASLRAARARGVDGNRKTKAALDRALDRVLIGDGCWLWPGHLNPQGYGLVRRPGEGHGSALVHRVVYAGLRGPIPEGLTIDHLCRVRRCCNPDHLEPVTNRENILRGESPMARQARRTHCIRGHLFDEANTYRSRNGERDCRACHRERQAARRARGVA